MSMDWKPEQEMDYDYEELNYATPRNQQQFVQRQDALAERVRGYHQRTSAFVPTERPGRCDPSTCRPWPKCCTPILPRLVARDENQDDRLPRTTQAASTPGSWKDFCMKTPGVCQPWSKCCHSPI